jgi:hypothetical protein
MGSFGLERLILRPDMMTYLAGGLSVAALIIWFVVRKRQQTVWLPTLRVVEIEARKLPKLRWRIPPWLAFLCFAISVAMLVMLSFRPREIRGNEYQSSRSRHHILVDLSPSVSAHISIEDLALRVGEVWQQASIDAKVSISTTHSPNFLEPKSSDEVRELIRQAGFHRAGAKLGEAVREMVENIRGVDGLLIVSDADKNSWDGFNWRSLLDEISITRIDIGAADNLLQNLYVGGVQQVSGAASGRWEWDVEIFRVNGSEAATGRLSLLNAEANLTQVDFVVPEGAARVVVRISIPSSKAKQAFNSKKGGEQQVLSFQIESAADNLLKLDDQFRSRLIWHGHEAILVTESIGERSLEDPSYHFESALEVLGFDVRRFEPINGRPIEFIDQATWFLVGGRPADGSAYCTDSLEEKRISRKQKPAGSARFAETNIWLLPASADADWRSLCHCVSRLTTGEQLQKSPPEFCADVDTRSAYVELLKSLGGKQVGGAVGSEGDALAWQFVDARSGFKVLALTTALSPNASTGMNYARIPVLLKALLEFQGVIRQGRELVSAEEWPRIESIVDADWRVESTGGERISELSNIPLGESLMAISPAKELPHMMNDASALGRITAAVREDESDPWPYVRLANILVVLMLMIEFLFRWMGRARARSHVASSIGSIILGLGLWMNGWNADAQVEVVSIERGLASPLAVSNLAMEVESRTSIELARAVKTYEKFSIEALRESWLWARESQDLIDDQGRFKSEIASWLFRGGFLVLNGKFKEEQLTQLTSQMLKGRRDQGNWTPIPPDHELMRSFYLLDALPECESNIWRGFQFDGRIAIIVPPFDLLNTVVDSPRQMTCSGVVAKEQAVRIFVNITMVALATDYKKDQIHLPEILKRLR